jgi:predicted nucleic acid-binding protein
MARTAYLADTSAFTRLNKPHVAAAIGPLIAEGKIALCTPVAFELGYSARNPTDHDAIMSRIDAFESAPTTEGDHQRALDLQRLLAQHGHHRALSLVDALVAAIAESRNLTILHYDADFELVSNITGQPNQWIVEPGSAD